MERILGGALRDGAARVARGPRHTRDSAAKRTIALRARFHDLRRVRSRYATEAIKTATTFFDGAEHFLMTERGIERADAVLTYDGQSRAAGDKVKSIDAALAAAKSCPALYQSCHDAYAKQCNEALAPSG